MSRFLIVDRIGPGASIQDLGRPGGMGVGLSRSGAADRHALLEGSALLGSPVGAAAIELTVGGGHFRVNAPSRIALTGANLRASIDGSPVETGTTYSIRPGEVLTAGAASGGIYGYLHVAGGLMTELELGGRGRHGIAGLGQDIEPGDSLPFSEDPEPEAPPMRLRATAPSRAPLRVIPGPQTDLFPKAVIDRFEATIFTRSPKGNRQGVRMDSDGAPFATEAQLGQVSDFICEGDIQMTGDGTPFVLLADCQTMGGYPRIGTVIPQDIPRVAQALPGETIQFQFISLESAEKLWKSDETLYRNFQKAREPRVRDPREMANLLSYELVDRPDPDVAG